MSDPHGWPSDPAEPPIERTWPCRHCGAELPQTRVGVPTFHRRPGRPPRWSGYHYTGKPCGCAAAKAERSNLQKVNHELQRLIRGGQ